MRQDDDHPEGEDISKEQFLKGLKALPPPRKGIRPDDFDLAEITIRRVREYNEFTDAERQVMIPLHTLFEQTGILKAKSDEDIDDIIALLKKSSSL